MKQPLAGAKAATLACSAIRPCSPCTLALFRKAPGYVLVDADTPGGTSVNGQRIDHSATLHSGDVVQVGNSLLVFNERAKRETAVATA